MTNLTTDEMADRIVRSLKDNSAELAKKQRSKGNARAFQIAFICLVFITGIAAGALLVTRL